MRILCTAKDSHIFSTKNDSVFVILMFEILTKRKLTKSLVLNNWAQIVGFLMRQCPGALLGIRCLHAFARLSLRPRNTMA